MIALGVATEGCSEANAFKVGLTCDFEGFGGGGFERCRQCGIQGGEGAVGDEEQSTAEGLGDAGNFRRGAASENDAACGCKLEAHAKLPSAGVGSDAVKLRAGAWLCHHEGHGITPHGIVWGFLVEGGGVFGAVGFDEYEVRRFVGLLYDVKTSDTRLEQALARVFGRSRFKRLDAFGFNANMNVNDQ
jgi:hypothetical protein